MYEYSMDWGQLRRKGDNRTKPVPGQYLDLEKFWSTSIRWHNFLSCGSPEKYSVTRSPWIVLPRGERRVVIITSRWEETRKTWSPAFVCCNCYYSFPICHLISISKYYMVSVLRINFLACFKSAKFTENCFLKELIVSENSVAFTV